MRWAGIGATDEADEAEDVVEEEEEDDDDEAEEKVEAGDATGEEDILFACGCVWLVMTDNALLLLHR